MVRAKKLLWIWATAVTLVACNPDRHLMPITTSSEEARKLFVRGRDLNENQNSFRADSFLHAAIQLDTNFAMAYLWLENGVGLQKAKELIGKVSVGEVFMIKSREAFVDRDLLLCDLMMDSLVALYPKDKHVLFYAGRGWFDRNEQKAIHYFQEAIHLDKYYAAPYGRIGYLLMREEQYAAAGEAFIKYLDLHPYEGNSSDSYGDFLLETGEIHKALKQYRGAVLLDPSFKMAYWKIAWIYTRELDFEQARKYCDLLFESVTDKHDLVLAHIAKANISYFQGDLAGTLAVLDQLVAVLEEQEYFADAVYFTQLKAWYALASNHLNDALSIMINSMEKTDNERVNPSDKQYLLMYAFGCLSIVYGEMGNLNEALKNLAEARLIYSNRYNIFMDNNFMSLFEGIFAINKGDYNLAISHLQLPADQTSMTCQYYLAKAYDLAGNKEQALRYYRKANRIGNYQFSGFINILSSKRLEELGQ